MIKKKIASAVITNPLRTPQIPYYYFVKYVPNNDPHIFRRVLKRDDPNVYPEDVHKLYRFAQLVYFKEKYKLTTEEIAQTLGISMRYARLKIADERNVTPQDITKMQNKYSINSARKEEGR